jgi:hypothetical protein
MKNPIKQKKFKPLVIQKTESEWSLILSKIEALGKKDLNGYVRSEVRKLTAEYERCPTAITCANGGSKKSRRPYIHEDSHKILQELSKKMKKPISSIVDEFIILPLLKS